jgi:hypothetical protein
MRVLVAFEEQLRTGGEAIASAIRRHRPRVEVTVAGSGDVEREAICFDPHLVISSVLSPTDVSGRLAWVFLSPDPEKTSEICLGAERREMLNPSLEELFSVLDEVERLVMAIPNRTSGDC